MFGPAFSGTDHLLAERSRLIHISVPPNPPGRLEEKNNLSPEAEREGIDSQYIVFTGAPIFFGAVHCSPFLYEM